MAAQGRRDERHSNLGSLASARGLLWARCGSAGLHWLSTNQGEPKMNTKHIVAIGVIVSIAALAGHRQALAQVQAVPTGFMSRGSAQGLLVPGQSIWPKPGDMVTIDSGNLAPLGSEFVDVLPNQSAAVFTVPQDRTFVMTHLEMAFLSNVDLVEEHLGVVTVKRGNWLLGNPAGFNLPLTRDYGFPLGVTFAPGSSVALSNPDSFPVSVKLNMTGYLADY